MGHAIDVLMMDGPTRQSFSTGWLRQGEVCSTAREVVRLTRKGEPT
jgi:hypothetical protein